MDAGDDAGECECLAVGRHRAVDQVYHQGHAFNRGNRGGAAYLVLLAEDEFWKGVILWDFSFYFGVLQCRVRPDGGDGSLFFLYGIL